MIADHYNAHDLYRLPTYKWLLLRKLVLLIPKKGPKISSDSNKIVKRAIRGMLPNHRQGRGKEIFSKIKCYNNLPEKLKNEKITELTKSKSVKFITLKELSNKL